MYYVAIHQVYYNNNYNNNINNVFWDTKGSPDIGQTTRPSDNQQKNKERTGWIVDFAVLADHRIKLKKKRKER